VVGLFDLRQVARCNRGGHCVDGHGYAPLKDYSG
jgi:hypothetical protein